MNYSPSSLCLYKFITYLQMHKQCIESFSVSFKIYVNTICSSPRYLLMVKLSVSSQDEKKRSILFLLSGVSPQVTTLPYFSFPCRWTFRLFHVFTTTNDTAGTILDVWPRAHEQVFLGWLSRRGTCGPLFLWEKRAETWKGLPGGLG